MINSRNNDNREKIQEEICEPLPFGQLDCVLCSFSHFQKVQPIKNEKLFITN